ncbi:MAG: hypothetical protein AB1425_00905 [Actinomycetota bacterium]
MMLRAEETPLLYEEEQHNLYAALEDLWYARAVLRRVGEEERRRFSESSWYYGDPSYYGGTILEIFDAQLATVLFTLFGEGFSGDLFYRYADGEEEVGDLVGELVALDDGPVVPEDSVYAPGDYEEILGLEVRASRRDIARLIELIRRSEGESPKTRLYRWRPGTDGAVSLGRDKDAVVMLVAGELFASQELVHGLLFEKLVRAWEVHNRG